MFFWVDSGRIINVIEGTGHRPVLSAVMSEQLNHAEARVVGMNIEPMPVTVTQAYVGAPVSLDVIAAVKQLGGGSVEPLVGGVPLFLEVVATDSAGTRHLTRVAFEVTTRNLAADERNLGLGIPPPQAR